ncbi:hypothetical protein ABPG72_000670 [Tetrahymena utriculariae]
MMNFVQKGQQYLFNGIAQGAQAVGMDLYSPLNGVDHVIIDQEITWWEMVPICNQENRYFIYVTNGNYQFNRYPKPPPLLGQFTETSGYCARQIMRQCRSFEATFRLGSYQAGKSMVPLKCHCPVSCCSCPCDRPELYVSDVSDQLMGTLKIPGYGPICCPVGQNTCSQMEIELYDPQGNLRFRIQSECCQKSVMCMPFKCCGCEQTEYVILDPNYQPTGGVIKNLLNECMTELFSSADMFAVSFPPNCFPQDKILLIHAAIWIDYLQYRA